MRCSRWILLIVPTLVLASCGEKNMTAEEWNTREVSMPDGRKVRAEVLIDRRDLMRGMMFRDSLAPDHGLLFIHPLAAKVPYWMYQVKVPLDIVWMDKDHTVVEVLANVPPCPSASAKECPSFGGNRDALFVIELAAGMAGKYKVTAGSRLEF